MVDIFTKEKRRWIMSRIRGKDTRPELLLRKELSKLGLRYRLHYKVLGSPDIAFPRQKLAVFVDGEFWHGYNWNKRGIVPRKVYWKRKITRNMERDKRYNRELKRLGWKVVRVWDHQINKNPTQCATIISRYLGRHK